MLAGFRRHIVGKPLRNVCYSAVTYVGFVAAAVSMPIGGCRARRPVVDMSVTVEPAVL